MKLFEKLFGKKGNAQLPPVRNPPPMPAVKEPTVIGTITYRPLVAYIVLSGAGYEDCMRVCYEVGNWLGQNMIDVEFAISKPHFIIRFTREADVALFKLRWGQGPV